MNTDLQQNEEQLKNYFAALADPQANVCTAEKQAALQLLQKKVAGCTLCSELAQQRHKTVFGVGHAAPKICFIGEAPGADEDRQGEPFVGRAGQLLDRILKACNWTRQDVYIANILKCRPPKNRNPLPSEVNNCTPYLLQQLQIIQPRVLCCPRWSRSKNFARQRRHYRQVARSLASLARLATALHLPPRLSATQSCTKTSSVGRHANVDAFCQRRVR